VSGTSCAGRRGQLAMAALGALDEAERAEVEAHLAGCATCRATLDELRDTTGALDTWAEGTLAAPPTAVPARLTEVVLTGLRADDELERRRRRHRIVAGVGAAAAAVVVAVVVLASGVGRPSTPTRTVALGGTPGVTASAVLEARTWGTSLTVTERGLAPGLTYTVSMSNPAGRWWTAGSYRAGGTGPVVVTMGCAASYGSIDEIRVTDPSGRTVLVNHPGRSY